MDPWCSARGLFFFKFKSSYSFLIFKFTAGQAFIKALSKSLVAGRGRFASLGCTTDRETDLKLQQRSWRYDNASLAITLAGEFSFCGQTIGPGYCTCRGPLRWRAVKAGEGSYWPGKLFFAGFINQIILLTLAGEFSNLLLQLTGAFRNKKWKIITIWYTKVKIYTFSC